MIPIFSFEGLPGAGKTTQIKRGAKEFNKKYGKSYYVDLPTDSSIGLLLKALYSNQKIWEKICKEAPWINPLLLSIDLKLAVEKAKQEKAEYILMSRGILSTYYYNHSIYIKKNEDYDIAWKELTKVLKGFIRPRAIIFLEIDPTDANKRVLKRNREPLRDIDNIDRMLEDRKLLGKYIEKLEKVIPIHYVDGSLNENDVTDEIGKIISNYLVRKV